MRWCATPPAASWPCTSASWTRRPGRGWPHSWPPAWSWACRTTRQAWRWCWPRSTRTLRWCACCWAATWAPPPTSCSMCLTPSCTRRRPPRRHQGACRRPLAFSLCFRCCWHAWPRTWTFWKRALAGPLTSSSNSRPQPQPLPRHQLVRLISRLLGPPSPALLSSRSAPTCPPWPGGRCCWVRCSSATWRWPRGCWPAPSSPAPSPTP
mmetsp:Transcript_17611/g.44330  ORF Transcript_17611/g.44330 Transcript_17611/m.44330 type:complete len:208 (-) Transcript_17611:1236-1859(-)